DQFSAQVYLHEEAIYLHEGAQYHVDRLDWEEKKAYVRPVKVDYYTDANLAVSIKVLQSFASRPTADVAVHHGEVQIRALATIFKKIRFHSQENIGSGPISLPEQQLHTTAFWLEIPAEVARQFPRPAMQGGLQGVANVLSQVACLFLMCDARDLGAHPEIRAPHTGAPTVYVYERYPGGGGGQGGGTAGRRPANCAEELTPFGPVLVRREWLADQGDGDVGALATCLGLAPDELRRPLFLDTETTGLSGGTGTVAFMV